MSILETFFILFKTDADKAADDIKKVDDASDDAEKGLKKVDGAATSVGASFVEMGKKIAAPLLAFATFATAATAIVGRVGQIRELDQFSSKLNSTIEDVDAFQRVVTGMGGESAAALDSLVKIGEQVNEAFSNAESGARENFDKWGISLKTLDGQAIGASEAMLRLADNLKGVSRAEALARIKALGIEDAATIDLLLKGRVALEEKIRAEKDLGTVTEEQARLTREYYGEMGRAQNAMTSLGNGILSLLLPAMTALARGAATVATWMGENKTLVTGFFVAVAAIITGVYLPAISAAATATIIAIAPFVAVAAAVAAVGVAFALAYEDVLAFMNGQPSLIGALAERYEWFAALIGGVGGAFDVVQAAAQRYAEQFLVFWTPVVDLTSAIGELILALAEAISGGLLSAVVELGDIAGGVLTAIADSLGITKEVVDTAASAVRDGFTAAFEAVMAVWDRTLGLIGGKISAIANGIRGVAAYIRGEGEVVEADREASQDAAPRERSSESGTQPAAPGRYRRIPAGLAEGQAAMGAAAASPINGQTSASITAGASQVSQTSSVTIDKVEVNTQATDAAGISKAIRGEMQRQLRSTASQFDDGVVN